tara:strand:- start:12581 stop:12961 length:381 start_codon:yes stop_codon:yes gene_type:complete
MTSIDQATAPGAFYVYSTPMTMEAQPEQRPIIQAGEKNGGIWIFTGNQQGLHFYPKAIIVEHETDPNQATLESNGKLVGYISLVTETPEIADSDNYRSNMETGRRHTGPAGNGAGWLQAQIEQTGN